VLANLLPGVRELRTPLVAGYVWLVTAWLILVGHIPTTRPAGGELSAFWDLGEAMGRTAVLAAVTFVAYMVGSILEINPQGRVARETAKFFVPYRHQLLLSNNAISDLVGYLRKVELTIPELEDEDFYRSFDFVRATGAAVYADDITPTQLWVLREFQSEIPQIATRLQVTNAELFGNYDRLLAEASLRLNLSAPVVLLVSVLAWRADLAIWQQVLLAALALGVGYFIARQGFLRIISARDVVVQALVSIDDVRSRRIDDRVGKPSSEG
jgi:hypothetical protein